MKGGIELFQPNLLKAAIVRAGYTQGEFAEKIGVSFNTLTRKMSGVSSFNIDEVDKAREVLSIDNSEVCAIFFGTDSRNREIGQEE